LHDFLRDKTVLLILDNFEHLVAEAELVLEILRTAAQVKVVITSRVPIQAQGEWLFPVAGLGLSDTLDDPEAAAQSDAVRLFVASAQRIDPGFEPTKDDLWHVLRICQLVRGLPLAILLAASWTAMLSPADIASHLLDELTSDLDFLRADWCDVPARQRSIRAVFDHSWALLGEREREQFCALSVFRGGFARDAAQAVAQVSLHDLMALVGRSLVHRGESGRYEMHELLRQYAAEKLALSQAESAVRDRHSAYYTAACQQWEVDLDSPRERIPLAVMDVEIENVRLAWDWAVARHEIERLDQALSALAYFYWQRVRLEEGAKAFGQAAQRLSALAEQSPAVSVDETHILGRVLWAQGRFAKGKTRQQLLRRALALLKGPQLAGYDVRSEKAVILLDLAYEYDPDHGGSGTVEATPLYEQSLVLFRELGDQRGAIRALSGLGGVAWSLGEYDRARLLMEECLELSPAVATPELVAPLLGRLGFVYLHRGELEQGERLFRKALSMAEQGQASWRIPSACVFLGVALTYQGRYVEARLTIKRALSFAENLSGYYVSGIENDLGNAEMHQGQYEQARILGEQALALAGSPRRKALCLFLLGRVALVEERFVEARAHLQEGTDISRELELKNDLALSLAALACTDLGLGRSDRAWRSATEVLHISSEIQGFRPCLYGLAVYALLILDQGETARAIEIYTLLLTYGHVAHSRWFEDVVGQHIAAAVSTASLPPEAIAAARKRGQGRDLQATARELLAELELEADGSASG
jgi:predicted ATPase